MAKEEKKQKLFLRLKEFFSNVKGELKKVTWPNKEDLQKTSIAVVVSSLVFGVYLFVVDFAFKNIFDYIIGLIK